MDLKLNQYLLPMSMANIIGTRLLYLYSFSYECKKICCLDPVFVVRDPISQRIEDISKQYQNIFVGNRDYNSVNLIHFIYKVEFALLYRLECGKKNKGVSNFRLRYFENLIWWANSEVRFGFCEAPPFTKVYSGHSVQNMLACVIFKIETNNQPIWPKVYYFMQGP